MRHAVSSPGYIWSDDKPGIYLVRWHMQSLKYKNAYVIILDNARSQRDQHALVTYAFKRMRQCICRNLRKSRFSISRMRSSDIWNQQNSGMHMSNSLQIRISALRTCSNDICNPEYFEMHMSIDLSEGWLSKSKTEWGTYFVRLPETHGKDLKTAELKKSLK